MLIKSIQRLAPSSFLERLSTNLHNRIVPIPLVDIIKTYIRKISNILLALGLTLLSYGKLSASTTPSHQNPQKLLNFTIYTNKTCLRCYHARGREVPAINDFINSFLDQLREPVSSYAIEYYWCTEEVYF